MSEAITDVFLIRHGETQDDYRGRCYGSLDVPLSGHGIRQMLAVASGLGSQPLSAIYSSPRIRCMDSASIIASGRDFVVIPVPALAELDFGQFEGKTYDEIAANYPALYAQWMEHPTGVQFPGGESFEQMRVRVLEAVRALTKRHSGQSFAMVTHGGVNRIVLADALGLAGEKIFRLGQRYASVNRIRYFGKLPTVELMNGCGSDCQG